MLNESMSKCSLNIEEDYECHNFSFALLDGIDYRCCSRPISFFRSDFRRANVKNSKFYLNRFDRADFIDTFFENVSFECVDFGSCLMKNAVVENSKFRSDRYKGVAMQYCYFKNCVFDNEHMVTNMYSCTFEECVFVNCVIEKSSLDKNTFLGCKFTNVDMAECIAENSSFDGCTLAQVTMCATHWATYLFRNTDLTNTEFKYHGELVDVWQEEASFGYRNLVSQQRYFEYINATIFGRVLQSDDAIVKMFVYIVERMFELPAALRNRMFENVLDMLVFYRSYSAIGFVAYANIADFLKELDFSDLSFIERTCFEGKIYAIDEALNDSIESRDYLLTIPRDKQCTAVFHLNFDQASVAQEYLMNLYYVANASLGDEQYKNPTPMLVEVSKGSIVLEVCSYLLLALMIAKTLKCVSLDCDAVRINRHRTDCIIGMLDNAETPAEIGAIDRLIKTDNTNKDDKRLATLESRMVKGEIISLLIEFASGLLPR